MCATEDLAIGPRLDWDDRVGDWVVIASGPGDPSVAAIIHGRRTRRVWAELWRAQQAGELAPSMRELARRCRAGSESTVCAIIADLRRMDIVRPLARYERNAAGERRTVARALRVQRPFGVEWL